MVFVYLLGLLLSNPAQTTGTLTASAHADPPPAELASPVREKIAPGGVRATANGISLTFWWVKELPLTGASWGGVAEGTLVGAVKVERDYRDIRGKIVKPGVYTLRYGIQPANGDHLGVSPFRDFLLLSPAAVDGTAAPQGHDGTVDLSKQTIGGSHPAVWSIDPPVATEAPLSIHTTDLGHKAVVVELAGTRDGKPEPMRFGLVLVGRIEA